MIEHIRRKSKKLKNLSGNMENDHAIILNEINVDYDTLMKIISELRNEGHLK